MLATTAISILPRPLYTMCTRAHIESEVVSFFVRFLKVALVVGHKECDATSYVIKAMSDQLNPMHVLPKIVSSFILCGLILEDDHW